VKVHADTMNNPRQAPSIRYSGQCLPIADDCSCVPSLKSDFVNATEVSINPSFTLLSIRPSDSSLQCLVTISVREFVEKQRAEGVSLSFSSRIAYLLAVTLCRKQQIKVPGLEELWRLVVWK
jgi:hypothetical protein